MTFLIKNMNFTSNVVRTTKIHASNSYLSLHFSLCFGHIVDLPSKELGVNIDNDFKPKYIVNDDKKKNS